jgi:hypothetical protein
VKHCLPLGPTVEAFKALFPLFLWELHLPFCCMLLYTVVIFALLMFLKSSSNPMHLNYNVLERGGWLRRQTSFLNLSLQEGRKLAPSAPSLVVLSHF